MGLVVNLFLNGVALGTLIFLTAAGLSLIFGLMGVLNFAHGAVFIWGAYVGWSVYGVTGNFALGLVGGAVTGWILGWAMERFFVRPIYGNHIAQILLTLGLMIALTESLKAVWGPNVQNFDKPAVLQGTLTILGDPFPVYKVFVIVVGALVAGGVHLALTRTRYGLIVRAGVENPTMVQALGIPIHRVFSIVFACGAALAAFGGVMFGPSFGSLFPELGLQNQLLAFIVVVIGGIGSFTGALAGSLLIGLTQTFVGYYWPEAALAVNVSLMAAVLLWKPQGLFRVRR